jgi:uncharacterized membrane protein YeaQ/YmgE (transglycosylase-associated protein family)
MCSGASRAVRALAIAALADVAAAAVSLVVSMRNETVARSGARVTLPSPVTVIVGMRRLPDVCAFAVAPEPATIASAASAARIRCFMVLQRKRARNRAAGFGLKVNGKQFLQDAAFGRGLRNGRAINMGLLGWLIVGLIAGVLAKWVVPGEGPGGIIGDIIVGIVGAFIGGWVFNFFGHVGVTGINLGSIVVAFIGAVILLYIMRAFSGRRSAI